MAWSHRILTRLLAIESPTVPLALTLRRLNEAWDAGAAAARRRPMRRWSATILIETDDDDGAQAALRAATTAAQAVFDTRQSVGDVRVSALMTETPGR